MANTTAAAPVLDHAAAGWHSEAKYLLNKGSSTTRREARKVAWLKRQIARSARRNSRRELRSRDW